MTSSGCFEASPNRQDPPACSYFGHHPSGWCGLDRSSGLCSQHGDEVREIVVSQLWIWVIHEPAKLGFEDL